MVINENNSFINSFTKGMNSDGAYDQLDGSLYIYGKNIRTTKNQFLGDKKDYASVHEGIITPVPEGLHLDSTNNIIGKILAVKSIDRLAIIITANDTYMHVYRFYLNEESNTISNFTQLWKGNIWKDGKVPSQISAVLYKELENVIKLYIADGVHPIICMRVDELGSTKLMTYNGEDITYVKVDDLINNRLVPTERIFILDIISGRLTTSLVQYTYRYYNKYGNTTQLAPLTNKIQVINPSRSKEIGNAENTETSIGFQIKINNIHNYRNRYERLLVFRLLYVTPGADAEVYLIYDGEVKETETNAFILNDVGVDPLQQYTMEEFSAMSGIILVPQIVELNLEYMFCSNVIDDTIFQATPIITQDSITTVEADVILSDKLDGDIPNEGNVSYTDEDLIVNELDYSLSVPEYFTQRGVNPDITKANYNNIFTSSLLRSLRRGEKYKYAIVYYDKFGRRTDVKSILTVSVPDINESNPFVIENDILKAKPIGVKIKIPQFDFDEYPDAKDIIGCLIIRRSSSDIYQNALLLVALSRPVSQGLLTIQADSNTSITEESTKKSPFYPSGFLTTNNLVIYPGIYEGLSYVSALYAKTRNTLLYQAFSSEIDFRRNDVLLRLNVSDTKLEEKLYVSAVFGKYTNATKNQVYDGSLPTSMLNALYNSLNSSMITVTKDLDTHLFHIAEALIHEDSESIIIDTDRTESVIISVAYAKPDATITQSLTETTWGDNNYYYEQFNSGDNIIEQIRDIWQHKVDGYGFYISSNADDLSTIYITQSDQPYNVNSSSSLLLINRNKVEKLTVENKQARLWIFDFFNLADTVSGFNQAGVRINQIKDVKIPDWNSAFTNIVRADDNTIVTSIKKYRSFVTNIDLFLYNNWVSFGKYDLRPGNEDEPNQDWGGSNQSQELIPKYEYYNWWLLHEDNENRIRNGFIGPGPSCFLISTEENTGGFICPNDKFYTSICNITHSPKTENVLSDEYTPYYGFGNYFNLHYVEEEGTQSLKTTDDKEYIVVFDGDIYITPHEFTTMYKTYNFESVDTLQSTLVTNYIPLESKVNTYFDYGMNLRNTNNENLLYEPGSIDGVTTQERPAHQYNMIYSDNDASNDVFTLISTDKNETNNFKQRTYYSEPKNNGEFIDNFLIFKTAAFIDVDSKYGQITNLLTDKNTLYYWLDVACGKFSVNERSLINDLNSNTIMLGQAGILSRYDYLSTKYGMRLHDFCAISSEAGVFWIDINNKAIAGLSLGVINYGERLNVLNIINDSITDDVPNISYDLQNNELVCRCFGEDLLVLNTKFNIATSIYTRKYDNILDIKNHLYGLKVKDNKLNIIKYNYLPYDSYEYMPISLEFVVNPMASVTKVFDSQQVVPIKRDGFDTDHHILENTTMSFETDIVKKMYGTEMEPYTDREGNIIYNVPRYENEKYGNRIRGKWMRVGIKKEDPTELFTLSHVITKFRQSFS